MRRYLYIIGAVITAILTSCSNDVEESIAPSPKMVEIAIVAQAEEDTRLSVDGNTTKWEVGDNISLYLIASYYSTATATLSITSSEDISADGKRAVFRGSVPEGYYYGVTALYPAMGSSTTTPTLDREADNNIFMASYKQYDPALRVTANSEIPITFSHLMHKVDYHLSLAEGYTSDDLNAESIAVEMSATTQGAPLNFASKVTYNVRSNTISTSTTTESIITYGKGNELQTMLFPLNTTRGVAFTFSVYINGEKRYQINKPESGTLNTFKMSAGKSTSVNLVLSRANSVGGGDIIEQSALILTSSKSSIDANGVDSAKLSVVEEGGEDVTPQCTLYLSNGTKLNSPTFNTTTPGTYTIYAERNGVRSNSVTITAKEVTTTGKTTIFAKGVTPTSGWYDVNKKSTPQYAQADAMMCWAASSSNIIQWFQDRYVEDGNTLPSGCPNGTSSKYDYELQIMDVFRDNWENLARGNWTDGGVIWYFEGRDLYTTNGTQNRAYPRSGTGGYFKSQWSSIYANMYHYEDLVWGWLYDPMTYITEINNYNWRGSTVADPLMKFSEYIVEAFDHGMSSMAVAMSSNFNGAHAVTIWGYEIDNATGYVTKLYIADSDDGSTPVLQTYTVKSESSNAKIVLNGYATYYPFALYPVSGYNSATE